MAKKIVLPSITEITKHFTKEKFLPVYFLCGEDQYSIDAAVEVLEKAVEPHILSDFDRETFTGEKSQNLAQLLDVAFSFPFGGGKKFLLIKNFEKFSDKKELTDYISHPPDFTVLVFVQTGKISDVGKEPYSSLLAKNCLFEARLATGEELIEWVTRKAGKLGIQFSDDNAKTLVEIVGEDKALLEMQLQKFINYKSGNVELTFEDIKKMSSPTKEYSIFDLQDSIGRGDKAKSVLVAYNLLDAGIEIVFIINMLAKFILVVAQLTELLRTKVSDFEAAKMAGVSYGYYMNCKRATYLMNDRRLLNASRALLNADLAVKTTASDPRIVLLMLISEILGQPVETAQSII
jgi:DNA polymerase III subunit delta